MTEIILSILTVLLGGTNIFQLFYIRAERRKQAAAAEEVETESNRKKYELSKDQANDLYDSLNKLNAEYVELQKQIREQAARNTQAIVDKCEIIADLKGKVAYFKGLRCYKSDCSQRISHNTKTAKDESSQTTQESKS